jgi:hypothetical protein
MTDAKSTVIISYNLLITIYLIIPIVCSLILLDYLLFHGAIKTILPQKPESIFFYTVIFGLPHIVASYFSLADKQYLQFYGKRLMMGIPVIIAVAYYLPKIDYALAALSLMIYTMIHVVFQQAGITTMMMRKVNTYFAWWRWNLLAIFIVSYYLIYFSAYPTQVAGFSIDISRQMLNYILIILLLTLTLISWKAHTTSQTTKGTFYFWSNYAIAVVGTGSLFLGYPVFAVLIPRVIHDLTAFVFYCAHDHNRYQITGTNWIYRFFAKFKVPSLLITPILALCVAYPLSQGGLYGTSLGFIILLDFFHFYADGFEWKRGSLHRQQLSFQE